MNFRNYEVDGEKINVKDINRIAQSANNVYETKQTAEGATLLFHFKGNKEYTPYLEVHLKQALKTDRSIKLYAQKLEETVVDLSIQQHFVDLVQVVSLAQPTFRNMLDYDVNMTKHKN